jgi:hypothetical protein
MVDVAMVLLGFVVRRGMVIVHCFPAAHLLLPKPGTCASLAFDWLAPPKLVRRTNGLGSVLGPDCPPAGPAAAAHRPGRAEPLASGSGGQHLWPQLPRHDVRRVARRWRGLRHRRRAAADANHQGGAHAAASGGRRPCAPGRLACLYYLACTHRPCIGCFPNGAAGLQEEIQFELDRRRPGQSKITTPRKETDTCELLSGMAPDGTTTLGTPICVLVRNQDQKSQDYTEMELAYRPSHAGARQRMRLRGMASQPSSQQRNHAAAPVSCQSVSACCLTTPPINCLRSLCRCHPMTTSMASGR